ncbi:MAG: hypothetical protein NC301_09155 [Bacteroides sp.]|nr:hypothetical protein [Bacteroides sp.]MCM1380250.1 hypothetical protein [Bacteroides sp.]MCM1446548.1 hypothetical protein [Prevotella sp.]
MPNLWLFNPENDLALAAGVANYTPPKSVVAFRRALAALPIWMAEPGDNIIAPGVDPQWLAATGLGVGHAAEGTPRPWGWSADAVRQFLASGVNGPFPDVEKIRQLSHRRTAQRLYDRLIDMGAALNYARPLEISDVAELPDTDQIVLKAPWSCSGRGVVDCVDISRKAIEARAEGTIRRQGSVMVEVRLPKLHDFAMLFYSLHGKVEYRGLSLFFNATATAYGGNIVAPEAELAADLGVDGLPELAQAVGSALTDILGADYEGPLGVDMMLYGDASAPKICPTVEVNLRYTMGFLALALQRRFTRGLLRVKPAGAIFTHSDGNMTELTPE